MTKSPADERPSDTHDHEIRVCYRDTDQMGIVYYANYFVYMEIARVEYLRARGWTYREMEEAGIRIPVVHAACDFKRPARYDDIVRVHVVLTQLTRVRLDFRYEMYCDARGELLATGESRHVFFDRSNAMLRIDPSVVDRIRGTGTGSGKG